MRISALRLALSVCLPLCMVSAGGCQSALNGRPKPTVDRDLAIAQLEGRFNLSAFIGRYNHAADEATRQAERDRMLDIGLALMDLRYQEFSGQFTVTKKWTDTGTEVGAVGLSAAAAVINPSSTTSILSAISGALVATNASFNKNFFYEQAVPVMLRAMEGQRAVVAAEIFEKRREGTDAYPMATAIFDLHRYYVAGTFEGALDTITRQSAEREAQAEERLKVAREAVATAKKGYGDWLGHISDGADSAAKFDQALDLLAAHLRGLPAADQYTNTWQAIQAQVSGGSMAGSDVTAIFGAGATFGSPATVDVGTFIGHLRTNARAADRDVCASMLGGFGIEIPN
ncbi:MAG: hypothetical protein AAGB51_07805 [Planctomycetota bacterium]